MLFLLLFHCGPDQWALVPLAIGHDIYPGPPSTSLAASVAGGRLACVHVLGETPLLPLRAPGASIPPILFKILAQRFPSESKFVQYRSIT
jgi:hypothetical protein